MILIPIYLYFTSGWTNPSEKYYASQIGSFHQVFRENKKKLKPPPRNVTCLWLVDPWKKCDQKNGSTQKLGTLTSNSYVSHILISHKSASVLNLA